ncbi:MAG TPA: oligosaccharide flippase family protein [Planctomycetota bacterium]|nr:oligosaccharide flippase family protein [Planctomycetota bacterium]
MSPDAETVANDSLRALVRRGAAWSIFSQAAAQFLRFASNLLLARLLFPEAFGLMAIVNALLLGLNLFSDVGIGPSIVQNARGNEPAFLNTAWTVQVVRGVALWLVACAIAVPVGEFYGDPRLAGFVAVGGLTALIGGFNSTRLHTMYRNVDLARVSLIDFAGQAIGLLTIVVWALVVPTPWALVAGGIAGSLAELVLSHTTLPGIRNRLQLDREALGQMLRFGRWIFLSTALTFLVMQSDKLVFGKLVDPATLGLYGFGVAITSAPLLLLGRIESAVFLPVFSRAHNAGDDLQAVFDRVRRPWMILAGWVFAGLSGGGQAVVDLLWDERYSGAGWITQLLSLAAWFGVLEMTNGAALLARGQAKWLAALNAGKLLGMVVLIPVGYGLGGFRGAVLGLVASEVLRYLLSALALRRQRLRGWPLDLRLTLWTLVTAWLGWQAALFGGRAHSSPLLPAACVALVVTLAWSPALAPVVKALRWRRG